MGVPTSEVGYTSTTFTILVCTRVKISRWERRIIRASYKLKVISFAEQFGNHAAQREFGILECNVRYWRKQKELFLKNAKSDSKAFRGPKAGKSAYFTHLDFSAAELKKKVRKLRE
jgi:hypothetical protein